MNLHYLHRTFSVLILPLLLTACGSSSGKSSASSLSPQPLLSRSECFQGSSGEVSLLEDRFGEGGACGFSPLWEQTLGPIGEGIDSCSLQYFLPAGHPDEATPAQVQLNAAGLEALSGKAQQQYIRLSWQDYFSSGYAFPTSQKLARFYDSDGVHSTLNVEVIDHNGSIQVHFVVRSELGLVEYVASHSQPWGFLQSGGVPVDEVIDFELQALLPSRQSPGFAQLSFSGVVLYLETDGQVEQLFSSPSQRCLAGFSGLWVGGNFSNIGQAVQADSVRYIDDIRVVTRH